MAHKVCCVPQWKFSSWDCLMINQVKQRHFGKSIGNFLSSGFSDCYNLPLTRRRPWSSTKGVRFLNRLDFWTWPFETMSRISWSKLSSCTCLRISRCAPWISGAVKGPHCALFERFISWSARFTEAQVLINRFALENIWNFLRQFRTCIALTHAVFFSSRFVRMIETFLCG